MISVSHVSCCHLRGLGRSAVLALVAALLAPVAQASRPRLNLLENPGFEKTAKDNEPADWRIGGRFSELSTERVHSGSYALKVEDTDPKLGSSVYSAAYSVLPQREYFVRGWAYLESGPSNSLGVYVQFLDAQGKAVHDADGQQAVCRPNLIQKRWIEFFQPMQVPEGATQVRLWIHTFNTPTCLLYLDDLQLLECFQNIFGETQHWEGGSPDHLVTHEAAYSVRWDHGQSPNLTRTFKGKAGDWSKHSGVSFWMHSQQATGNAFMFVVVSENPITLGMDYWSTKITVDWEGWKQFVYTFREMGKSRMPLGLDQIGKVTFAANGWGNTADPDTVIHLEGMRPVNVSH